jgi:hypothetical protein
MNKIPDITEKELKVVNLGLKSFYESLKDQEVPVVHMNWKPPAGGKQHLLEILKKLK